MSQTKLTQAAGAPVPASECSEGKGRSSGSAGTPCVTQSGLKLTLLPPRLGSQPGTIAPNVCFLIFFLITANLCVCKIIFNNRTTCSGIGINICNT